MATEIQALKGLKLKNLILSSNPCPVCREAANQPPMTKSAWKESPWGLPDSKKRYCNLHGFNCHCLMVPVEMIADLPAKGKKILLRGDKDTDIRSIVEITPRENRLKELMEEYNETVGKLPSEIYTMPLEEIADFLEDLLRGF